MIKSVLEKAALIISGPLFMFLVCELGLRGYYLISDFGAVSLERQLAQAEGETPPQNGEKKETTLGSLVHTSADPDIVYELKPSISGTFQGRNFTFNSHGMRDDEYSTAKPVDTIRVAAIGDSVLFGWGVAQNLSYTAVAERFLNDHSSGRHYEILNFGVPGYNTAMEAAVFEKKVLQFSPDVLVIHFVSNDWGVPLFMQHSRDPWALDTSYFFDLIRSRMSVAIGSKRCRELLGDCDDFNRDDQRLALKQYMGMVGEAGFRRAIKRIGELTKAHNIPVVIIYGKATPQMEKRINQVCKQWGFEQIRVKPYVDEFVARTGIPDDPKSRAKALSLSPFDHHPNDSGHKCYAEALLDIFSKMPAFDGVKFGERPRIE